MSKLFKKLTVLLLVLVLAFGTAACSGGGGDDSGEKPDYITNDKTNYSNISVSDTDLVKNGGTEYKVVYPAGNKPNMLETCISELTLFFEQATGISLNVIDDSDATWSSTAKYISLGETSLVTDSGVTLDKSDMKQTSYSVKTKGNTVFLRGGDYYGVLNAVYRFLHEQFNYECYAADEIVLDEGVTDEKLLNFDVKVVKDITWHVTGSGELRNNTMLTRRLGMNNESDFLISIGEFFHNFLDVVNPDDLTDEQKEKWISPDGSQVCMSRDLEGLAAYVIPQFEAAFLANPEAYAVGFTQEDDHEVCGCESCQTVYAKYGAKSAAEILFLNYVCEKMESFWETNFPGQEKYIYFFAYQSSEAAPAVKNAAGEYEPTYPEMKCHDRIYVQWAPIYAASYHSYETSYNQARYAETCEAWGALTDNLMFWTYSFYYKENVWPYYDFSDMRDTFAYCAARGEYMFDEEQSGSAVWTDFTRLKIYLKSKLGFDTECDLNAYTDAFFENYYKQAAGSMKKMFDSYSTHYSYIIQKYNIRGQGGQLDINDIKYWPSELVDYWLECFNQAYKDIEPLRTTDYEAYTLLEYRICLDTISIRYLAEQIHNNSSVYVGNGNSLSKDASRFGITI